MSVSLSRREFLCATSAMAGAFAVAPALAKRAAATRWPIGANNRPFRTFRASATNKDYYVLDAIKAAGYDYADMIGVGGAGGATATPMLSGRAVVTADSLVALNRELASRGLKTMVGALGVRTGVPLAEAVASARDQIAAAHTLGQKFAISFGVEDERDWVQFCKVLADAAAFGQERGVQVAIKHHHGLNNTSLDLLAWIKQVNHPNFGVFYDAANLFYYTGKDPLKQLEIIAPYVRGIVAKDCASPEYEERAAGQPAFGSGPPDPGGNEVMIQFGTGRIDFAGLFRRLKTEGFDGPIMIEGTKVGATLDETIANSRANRLFLEALFSQVS